MASAIADVEAASHAASNGRGDLRLIVAVASLSKALLPHLEREEREMMPVVSSVVTGSEWGKREQQFDLEGKSSTQLGFEGHWLIDDVSAEVDSASSPSFRPFLDSSSSTRSPGHIGAELPPAGAR